MVGDGVAEVEAAGSGGSDGIDSWSPVVGWLVCVNMVLVVVFVVVVVVVVVFEVVVVGGVVDGVAVENVGDQGSRYRLAGLVVVL